MREGGRRRAVAGAALPPPFSSSIWVSKKRWNLSEGEGLLWLCLPVCLHTRAHALNVCLYLPEYTHVHFHSLPHPSTGVTAHTSFAHMLAPVSTKWGTSE